MKIKGLAIAALAASLTAGAVTTAVAQDVPNWIGVSVGNSQFSSGSNIINSSNTLSGISPDSTVDSDTAWKIYLGIPFNKYLGLELGYAKLGDQSIRGIFNGNPASSRATSTAYLFDLVGNFEFNESFSLLGKLGFHRWGVNDDTLKNTINTGNGADGFDATYGLGVQYNVNKDVGLRMEWERIKEMGHEGTTGKIDADLITIGVTYKFNIL
jgi:opacity protein-like surface antigen